MIEQKNRREKYEGYGLIAFLVALTAASVAHNLRPKEHPAPEPHVLGLDTEISPYK